MSDGSAPRGGALGEREQLGLWTDPLGVVQAIYDAIERGEIPTVLSLLDEQVEWQFHGPDTLPTAGLRVGRGEVARFFSEAARTFERLVFEITDLCAKEDRVLALGYEHGVVRGSAVRYESPLCHVWTVRGGRVTRWRCFLDTATVMAAVAA